MICPHNIIYIHAPSNTSDRSITHSLQRCVSTKSSISQLECIFYFFSACFFFSHCYFPASGQAVVTGVVPSPSRFLPFQLIFNAHRVQQSLCSSIFHRVLPTHALALSTSQFVRKKKSQRIYTSSMHSMGLELTKLTYTRLEDNLTRHWGDRVICYVPPVHP